MSRGPYPILLMLAMSLPGAVRALGLGDIRIDSALNEPLTAQIDIVGATRDELAALTASVANREIFQRYGADRPSFLSSAIFKVGMDSQGRPVLNVRSADAFTDPLVSFLVDIRWGKNEIVREYSLLLDPPGYKYPRPAADVALAAVAAEPAAAVVSAAAVAPAAAVTPAGASVAHAGRHTEFARHIESDTAAGHTRVKVASGDTLRGVARRAGARSETEAQTMMIAIFRANPNAFEGNINRLHNGAVLTIPTAAEFAGLSSTDAKREVRAQMTAWRLDGRPSSPHRLVASSTAPLAPPTATAQIAPTATAASPMPRGVAPPLANEQESADAALKKRVQTLEQALDDMHKQLANENATLQDLKQISVQPPVHAQAPAQVQPQSEPSARAAAPAASAAAASQSAELVQVPIVAVAHAVKAVAPPAASQTPTRSAEIFGPVAVTVGLLVAGFAYVRRRLVRAPAQSPAVVFDPPAESPESVALSPTPSAAAAAVAVKEAPKAEAFNPGPTAAIVTPPSRAATAGVAAASPETMALNLDIDIEALERSYLESLPVDPSLDDTTTLEGTTVETVAIDTEDLHTALIDADVNTVLMDARNIGSKPIDSTALDFNLLDLDASDQHVNMPSGLNDHPVSSERRTNIADVLKMAIERDPNRRDLRMKLLETYYSVASANQRAFMDVVRKLSREKDGFSADEWNKVAMMGREIAADDILFADLPKDDKDMANCA